MWRKRFFSLSPDCDRCEVTLVWVFFNFFFCFIFSSGKILHSMGLLPKLLFKLSDPSMTVQKVQLISDVIASLLDAHFTPQDISRCRPPANKQTNKKKKTSSLELSLRNCPRQKSVSFAFRLGLFLVYTLPCPDGVNESSLMCGDHPLPGAFFDSQITLHVSHKCCGSAADPALPHQLRVQIRPASSGSEISCCSSCLRPLTRRPFS